jgi:hypothetical protein
LDLQRSESGRDFDPRRNSDCARRLPPPDRGAETVAVGSRTSGKLLPSSCGSSLSFCG